MHALKKALDDKGVIADGYRVVSCSLHNLQTCLRQVIQKVYGEGGMIETNFSGKKVKDYKKKMMQLLNGLYNIFTYIDIEEMRKIWKVACEDLGVDIKFMKLTNPVVKRW